MGRIGLRQTRDRLSLGYLVDLMEDAIYFLLCPGERSAWHVVRSDELWLWHAGGPLTLRLGGSGAAPDEGAAITLGGDVADGQQPQAMVPGGTWQSALPAGRAPALVSCVVSPGFDLLTSGWGQPHRCCYRCRGMSRSARPAPGRTHRCHDWPSSMTLMSPSRWWPSSTACRM